MRDRVDAHKLGLIVGFFMAIVHIVWSLMVLGGVGQNFLDWIFGLHMISNPITVGIFGWGTAIYLWVVVFIIGYIAGWVLAWVHNTVHAGKRK